MTRAEWNRRLKEDFAAAGIEAAAFEAAELLCFVLGLSKIKLLSDGGITVPEQETERLVRLAEKRISGYPLQYILGEWEFYGYPFSVGEGVLIPRADTEVLCENGIRHIGDQKAAVLDLCSGSGCLAVAVSKQCANADVYAIEKSEQAFAYLKQNINRNQAAVTAFCADALSEKSLDLIPDCDLILSNPPYLTEADMEHLQREVCFEPQMALFGEEDGLYFYRELTRLWKTKLKAGGMLAYEIGAGQHQAVIQILLENGFASICETPDVCGIIRTISGICR